MFLKVIWCPAKQWILWFLLPHFTQNRLQCFSVLVPVIVKLQQRLVGLNKSSLRPCDVTAVQKLVSLFSSLNHGKLCCNSFTETFVTQLFVFYKTTQAIIWFIYRIESVTALLTNLYFMLNWFGILLFLVAFANSVASILTSVIIASRALCILQSPTVFLLITFLTSACLSDAFFEKLQIRWHGNFTC